MGREDREARRAKYELGSMDKFIRNAAAKGGTDKLAVSIPQGVRQFTPVANKTYKLLFIPYAPTKGNPAVKDGVMYWERTYYTHPMLGPNRECVFCAAMNHKVRCAVCEENMRIRATPWAKMTIDQQEKAKALKPKQRQMFQVVDLEEQGHGVQILEISNFCFGQHLGAKIARFPVAEQAKMKLFWNPKDPFYLQVGVTEGTVGGGKPFPVMNDIEFKRAGKPIPDKFLDAAVCLDELVLKPKYAEVAALLNPGTGDEDEVITTKEISDEEEAGEADGEGFEVDEEGDEVEDQDEEGDDGGDEGDEEPADDDDDGEPEPVAAGDAVTFLRKGIRTKAVVLKIKDEKALVKLAKTGEKLWKDLEDLMLLDAEEPAPKKKPKAEVDDDDEEGDDGGGEEDAAEDEDEVPARRVAKRPPGKAGGKPPAGKKPVKKAKAPEPDDDDADDGPADDFDF